MRKKNTRLSMSAQLQCLSSGAWEPGNEANCVRDDPGYITWSYNWFMIGHEAEGG